MFDKRTDPFEISLQTYRFLGTMTSPSDHMIPSSEVSANVIAPNRVIIVTLNKLSIVFVIAEVDPTFQRHMAGKWFAFWSFSVNGRFIAGFTNALLIIVKNGCVNWKGTLL